MQHRYTEESGAVFRLSVRHKEVARQFFQERHESLLAIAWNRGKEQIITVDEVPMRFPQHSVIALVVSQSFRFEHPEDVILWQFNREFYCIIDHDREVSCVGFLFYGLQGSLVISLDGQEQESFSLLLHVFEEEFRYQDMIQGEMLRVLLKRLVIKLMRLAKQQQASKQARLPSLT